MRWIWFGVAVAFASPALAQRPAERDWAAALRADARALHDETSRQSPGRRQSGGSGLLQAQRCAAGDGVEAREDREDLCRRLSAAAGICRRVQRWPYDHPHLRGRAERISLARLSSPITTRRERCASIRARTTRRCRSERSLSVATVARRRSWRPIGSGGCGAAGSSESTRQRWGRTLFLDEHNIAVPPLARCTFRVDGRQRTIALEWKPIDSNGFWERALGRSKDRSAHIQKRGRWPTRTRWYAMPSFNGDAQSDAGKALPGLIAAMQADRNAPAIVLDLRRNNGGSSDWSQQIAQTLWGQQRSHGLPKSDTAGRLARLRRQSRLDRGKLRQARGRRLARSEALVRGSDRAG